jgi:hypothetical protein
VSFDTDFVPLLDRLIGKYGEPQKVNVTAEAWTGAGGGYVQHAHLVWYKGDDRVKLSFNPEEHNSDGSIKLARSAHVDYGVKNACWKADNW